MSLAAPRAVLRHSKFTVRRAGIRNASSTSETATEVANAAKQRASAVASKASEGLTRVASMAGPALSKAGEAATNAAGKVGGRTGRLLGAIQSVTDRPSAASIPTAVYYSKVALELGKVVAKERKMSPPDVATFQSYYQSALARLRNPSELLAQAAQTASKTNPQNVLNQIRNMGTGQWVTGGVVAAEILGFFTVGEMIGRRHIVGYRKAGHGAH
ncbi:mitochondrial F1F0-ATP synthase-like protein g subunit [Amniculicola lignicola CBS 123094]|uniref:Mitochondrial F1F0-ATP synthase-like protein g subunit n=1 Tax=Amniculicola lignicola CBS 123094 TaxID=1392246 RepID=A0A6A5VX09_9PLEO|nr:mitochondrial F1F0-ATP synthase-like protein g subunit [Amniculicola lignicola CBS 123094]